MERNYLEELLKKYQCEECTDEEKAIIETWYLSYRKDSDLPISDQEMTRDLESVYKSLPVPKQKNRFISIPVKMMAAAAVLIVIGMGVLLNFQRGGPTDTTSSYGHAIVPGGDKAVLTLADGSKIILDKANEGEIVNLPNISIRKTAEGKIIYVVDKSSDTNAGSAGAYNTIETPRGGQYEVQLPDGSRVWLNAASSLRYPIAFAGHERKVELTGEAFFEIAHDQSRPFRVLSSGQMVEVLGTTFNLNAYADEQSVNTTLLEGSVKIVSGGTNRVIKPGQQAKLFKNSLIDVAEVNTESVIAWKNGYFKFDDTDLVSLMRQLSRWYDFDVVYEGEPANDVYVGEIRRNASLANVLKIIELGDVNFRIEGKTIYIRP